MGVNLKSSGGTRGGNDGKARLLQPEALRLIDRQSDLLHQRLVRSIRRQVEAIEARVAQRQSCLLPHALDREQLEAVAPWPRGKKTPINY